MREGDVDETRGRRGSPSARAGRALAGLLPRVREGDEDAGEAVEVAVEMTSAGEWE